MSESARIGMEVCFNVAYLAVIWALVIAMWRRRAQVPTISRPICRLFVGAFAVLALGDSGHLGFRMWAYALGDLNATIRLFGVDFGLAGLGALATAITVTLFYVLIQVIWQRRFRKKYGWFGIMLFATVLLRFTLMIPEPNQWNATVPPQPWSIYRNLPLIVLGLGIAFLILKDALTEKDRAFTWIGLMIVISYAFYMPVIFFVQQVPMIGMLMIPKTMAYVAVAFIAYFHYFRQSAASPHTGGLKTA